MAERRLGHDESCEGDFGTYDQQESPCRCKERSGHDSQCERDDPDAYTAYCRCADREEAREDLNHLARMRDQANALQSVIPSDAQALEELRKKLYDKPRDDVLWEDEGMIHRAALTAHGDYGVAVLWVAQVKVMDGHTVYLTAQKRRELAAALLKDLPEETD